ncbi:GNAT family N-acetyltransferase [Viridibacterium curvum]|uniref:GNAT family N-acetyltransferase n=1 Tax=Viridibacterium curvum TaxID=1101404 RepID=A0ABP9R438_9RHOO
MSVSAVMRRAVGSDLAGLLDLYRHLHADDPVVAPAVAEAQWAAILANPLLHYFVIEEAGMLVSTCTLSVIPNLTRGLRPYGLVENVVTHPDWRGRGLATQLLHAARDAAWAAGCYKLMLMTSRKAPATLAFYERAGFIAGDKMAFVMRPE